MGSLTGVRVGVLTGAGVTQEQLPPGKAHCRDGEVSEKLEKPSAQLAGSRQMAASSVCRPPLHPQPLLGRSPQEPFKFCFPSPVTFCLPSESQELPWPLPGGNVSIWRESFNSEEDAIHLKLIIVKFLE